MNIAELIPQEPETKSPPPLPVPSDSRVSECHKPIHDAMLESFRLFENIKSQFVRDVVKKWLATDLNLLKTETLIEKEYQKALLGDEKALQNVKSGMEYWRELVNRKVTKCLEEAGG